MKMASCFEEIPGPMGESFYYQMDIDYTTNILFSVIAMNQLPKLRQT